MNIVNESRALQAHRNSTQEGVVEVLLSHGHLYVLRAATPGLFALTGSFRTAPVADRGEWLLQQLVAALATCGSSQRDQFKMAELLENRGASLSIESDMNRISFSARACSVDLPLVMELLAECLREPRFDAENFVTEQARLIAELDYSAADTATMAADALSRAIYPSTHLRYQADVVEEVALLERFTVEDVRRYHRTHFGANDLRIAVVGDIDPLRIAAECERRLASWPARPIRITETTGAFEDSTQRIRIAAPDSENFEVAIGHGLTIRCNHPDYMALWMANHILGSNFSSRLVTAVRAEKGLTYSIRSQLTKPHLEFDGHWQIDLSLSPDKLDTGLAATRDAIIKFVDAGVSPLELANKQREAIGGFQISLATLYGLSETILFGAERGWGPNYLYDFAGKVGRVTATQLNRTIAEHLRPAALCVAIAGPFVLD